MHKLFTFMIRLDESCHLVCQWTMCASSSLFISLLFKMLKVTWFRTDWTVCWVGSVRCRPDTNVIDIMRASLFSFLQCKNTVLQSPWSMANGCVSLLRVSYTIMPPKDGAIKAFKKGVLYHGEDCNRGPKNDPPILEPAFLLVNRWSYMTYLLGCLQLAWSIACQLSTVAL